MGDCLKYLKWHFEKAANRYDASLFFGSANGVFVFQDANQDVEVGSTMVEQQPFKPLVVSSSLTRPPHSLQLKEITKHTGNLWSQLIAVNYTHSILF